MLIIYWIKVIRREKRIREKKRTTINKTKWICRTSNGKINQDKEIIKQRVTETIINKIGNKKTLNNHTKSNRIYDFMNIYL